MATKIVALNLDTTIAAYEARPESRARAKAWEWLCEQSRVSFSGAALVVPSATWERTTYQATLSSCTCEAKKPCWHMEAAAIVAAAQAEDQAVEAQARREKAYADMAELFA